MFEVSPEELPEHDAYCTMYNKPLSYVTEHEQEACSDNGLSCLNCPYFAEINNGIVILD